MYVGFRGVGLKGLGTPIYYGSFHFLFHYLLYYSSFQFRFHYPISYKVPESIS